MDEQLVLKDLPIEGQGRRRYSFAGVLEETREPVKIAIYLEAWMCVCTLLLFL